MLCKKRDCLRGEAEFTTDPEFLNQFTVESAEGHIKRFDGLRDAGGVNIVQERAADKSKTASPAPTPFFLKEAYRRPIVPSYGWEDLRLAKGESAHERGGEENGEYNVSE